VGVELRVVGYQPIQTSERGGRRAHRHKKCEEGRRKWGHNVSKCPTVLPEHRGDSAISEGSATRDNYSTDQQRLKTDS